MKDYDKVFPDGTLVTLTETPTIVHYGHEGAAKFCIMGAYRPPPDKSTLQKRYMLGTPHNNAKMKGLAATGGIVGEISDVRDRVIFWFSPCKYLFLSH